MGAGHQAAAGPRVALRERKAADPIAAAGLDVAVEPGPPGVTPVRVPAIIAIVDAAFQVDAGALGAP